MIYLKASVFLSETKNISLHSSISFTSPPCGTSQASLQEDRLKLFLRKRGGSFLSGRLFLISFFICNSFAYCYAVSVLLSLGREFRMFLFSNFLIMTETMELGVTPGQGVMSPGLESIFQGVGILGLAISILMLIAHWKVLEKAKLPGWGILIPFYNLYLLLKLAGHPKWTWWLLFPPVLAILMIVAQFEIAKKFGKGAGFGVGLWLLPIVFYPLLAFDKKVVYTPEA